MLLSSNIHHQQILINSDNTDQITVIEQIRCSIPHASANPSLHTRFHVTDVAYMRASVHTNQHIPLYIFHCAYALSLQRSRVYTRFLCGELAYGSSEILGHCISSEQIIHTDLTLHFRQMFASSQI